MSPCTIEKDVVDAMKKFRRASNKTTMAILCKLMRKKKDSEKYFFFVYSTM